MTLKEMILRHAFTETIFKDLFIGDETNRRIYDFMKVDSEEYGTIVDFKNMSKKFQHDVQYHLVRTKNLEATDDLAKEFSKRMPSQHGKQDKANEREVNNAQVEENGQKKA